MSYFDGHSHYMPRAVAQNTAFFKVNWSDIDRQLSVMDVNHIEKALLLYPTSDAHIQMGGWAHVCQIYNEEVAKVVSRYPQRFWGAGILPVDNAHALAHELSRIHQMGLQVISLASSYEGVYLSDERFSPVYEFARKHAMPVHVHPQIMAPIGEERVKDPLLTPVLEYVFDVSMCVGKMLMEGTFLRFPEVDFIFAHYGGVLPFVRERFDTTYAMLRGRNFVKDLQKNPSDYFKNIYFDTSGSKSAASLSCALELTDAKHIIFGSDFPANQSIAESISAVEKAPITAHEKETILKNTLALLLSR